MTDSSNARSERALDRLKTLATETASAGAEKAGAYDPAAANPAVRHKQMQIVRDLLANPPLLDLAREPINCASTQEEIIERRRELEYRLQWLRALIEMTESELSLLGNARSATPPRADAEDAQTSAESPSDS